MPGHIQQSMDIVLATACGGLSELWKIIGIPWQKEKLMVYMSVYHHFWICLVYNIIYIYLSILIIIHCGYVHDIWLKIAYTWCHLGWLPGYHSHLSIDVTAWGPITYPSIVCVYIYIFIHVIYICISMCINLHIVSHEVSIPSIHRLSLNIPISLAI